MSLIESKFYNNSVSTIDGVIYNLGDLLLLKISLDGNTAILGNEIFNVGVISVVNLIFLDNSTINTK